MTNFFFYGSLCHPPLLRAVLGRDVQTLDARLDGHSVFWAKEGPFPVITETGGRAIGVCVVDMSADDIARLDFYEGGFAYHTRDVTVATSDGPMRARVYYPNPGQVHPASPWVLEDWIARWGDVAVATASDVMRRVGHVDPAKIVQRYPMMMTRGGARLRAKTGTRIPGGLRRHAEPADVAERHMEDVYANYFAVEEYDLRFRRFDGAMSPEVNRAVFISGDAAVVLPYDPVRDRVLLIEQFRMGPYARGDSQPWLLEAIAGRIDGGETPEAAAIREAREEAGLELRDLIPASHYYPSPGAKAEYLYTYVGIADLPDSAAGLGGLSGEDEDIRAHVVSFDRFMELIDSGEANTAPLIILGNWLGRHRARLRASRA
ncbi:MAG: NUDIX domain-containing protein [Albidovulum sp.]